MKALVFHDIEDIRFEDVPEPVIRDPFDAIVEITSTAICGTDLHMVRGSMTGMQPGTILGHEGVGIVREVGNMVRNVRPGDRVVIPSTIACGYCSYCRAGYFSQCDNANPNGKRAGTAFFGGPKMTGAINGLQAEFARVPFANIGLLKIPETVADSQAILLSDIFPTGYFGADIAGIKNGDTVAVFGCGPVGCFTILSAFLMEAGRVIAVDHIESRLEKARDLGAEIINFEKDSPVDTILELTGGIGVDKAIDAVGVDAEIPRKGPLAEESEKREWQFRQGIEKVKPSVMTHSFDWCPGNRPSLAMEWEIDALAKAGTLSVIGVSPGQGEFFPIGKAMNKNIRVHTGNCPHRRYLPHLMNLVESKTVHPEEVLTHVEPLNSILEAYKNFESHYDGWVKVVLEPEIAPLANRV